MISSLACTKHANIGFRLILSIIHTKVWVIKRTKNKKAAVMMLPAS